MKRDTMMEHITWQDSYNTGFKEIDEQHRRLVEMINGLYRIISSNAVRSDKRELLLKLVDYAKVHFKYEEILFARYDYPLRKEHVVIHRDFLKKIVEFNEREEDDEREFSYRLFLFLKEWLIDHILKEDRKYCHLFREKGLR